MLKPTGEGLSGKGCGSTESFQKRVDTNLSDGRFVAGDSESMDS